VSRTKTVTRMGRGFGIGAPTNHGLITPTAWTWTLGRNSDPNLQSRLHGVSGSTLTVHWNSSLLQDSSLCAHYFAYEPVFLVRRQQSAVALVVRPRCSTSGRHC
ncbi:Protein of unknown function, partial [Gryllus bimaculatus]